MLCNASHAARSWDEFQRIISLFELVSILSARTKRSKNHSVLHVDERHIPSISPFHMHETGKSICLRSMDGNCKVTTPRLRVAGTKQFGCFGKPNDFIMEYWSRVRYCFGIHLNIIVNCMSSRFGSFSPVVRSEYIVRDRWNWKMFHVLMKLNATKILNRKSNSLTAPPKWWSAPLCWWQIAERERDGREKKGVTITKSHSMTEYHGLCVLNRISNTTLKQTIPISNSNLILKLHCMWNWWIREHGITQAGIAASSALARKLHTRNDESSWWTFTTSKVFHLASKFTSVFDHLNMDGNKHALAQNRNAIIYTWIDSIYSTLAAMRFRFSIYSGAFSIRNAIANLRPSCASENGIWLCESAHI